MVDNASADDTVAIARAGGARVLALSRNAGFGEANNLGVRAASHDAVVLLNPDTFLLDGTLRRLGELARITRALCGPRLLNEDGSVQPSASTRPAGWELAVRAVIPAGLLPRRLRERCEPWRAERQVDVGWLTGACIAAPRDVLLELGPFDEALSLYGEDIDLGVRARERGYRCIFAPGEARVVHLGERSAARRFSDRGLELAVATRRQVVRMRLGGARERYDFATETLFHLSRYLIKRGLRRDAERELAWLKVAARLARSSEDAGSRTTR